jgi:hypothetical protein
VVVRVPSSCDAADLYEQSCVNYYRASLARDGFFSSTACVWIQSTELVHVAMYSSERFLEERSASVVCACVDRSLTDPCPLVHTHFYPSTQTSHSTSTTIEEGRGASLLSSTNAVQSSKALHPTEAPKFSKFSVLFCNRLPARKSFSAPL